MVVLNMLMECLFFEAEADKTKNSHSARGNFLFLLRGTLKIKDEGSL